MNINDTIRLIHLKLAVMAEGATPQLQPAMNRLIISGRCGIFRSDSMAFVIQRPPTEWSDGWSRSNGIDPSFWQQIQLRNEIITRAQLMMIGRWLTVEAVKTRMTNSTQMAAASFHKHSGVDYPAAMNSRANPHLLLSLSSTNERWYHQSSQSNYQRWFIDSSYVNVSNRNDHDCFVGWIL